MPTLLSAMVRSSTSVVTSDGHRLRNNSSTPRPASASMAWLMRYVQRTSRMLQIMYRRIAGAFLLDAWASPCCARRTTILPVVNGTTLALVAVYSAWCLPGIGNYRLDRSTSTPRGVRATASDYVGETSQLGKRLESTPQQQLWRILDRQLAACLPADGTGIAHRSPSPISTDLFFDYRYPTSKRSAFVSQNCFPHPLPSHRYRAACAGKIGTRAQIFLFLPVSLKSCS